MDRGDTFDRAISIFMKFQTLRTVEYLIEIALVPCSLDGQVTKKSREKNLLLVPSVCPREIGGVSRAIRNCSTHGRSGKRCRGGP